MTATYTLPALDAIATNLQELTDTPRWLQREDTDRLTTAYARYTGAGHMLEVRREDRGDALYVDVWTAQQRMAPVRLGGPCHLTAERTVAFLGLDERDGNFEVSWGLSWTLHRPGPVDYYDGPLCALEALAFAYLL